MDGQGADINEDVPPLEDMSEELEKIRALRTPRNKKVLVKHADTVSPQQGSSLKPTVSVNGSKDQQLKEERSQVVRTKEKTASNSKSSFGGFRKGFLVSSLDSKPQVKRKPPSKKTPAAPSSTTGAPSSKKTPAAPSSTTGAPPSKKTPAAPSSTTETTSSKKTPAAPAMTASASSKESDIPYIQPKNEGKSSLEFPEVQQAMKEAFPLLQSKDWVTDDLLSKIHDNPVLSEAFSDPALAQVLAQLQSNPQAVAATAKDNPKVQKFVQEFCALMGDHFTMLADKDEKDQVTAATNTPHISEAMSSEEEAEMREIISRPQVKEALSDPRIEELIIALKDDPPAAQRLLRSGNEDFQRKVKVLIDNQLVNFQSI